MHRNHLQLIMCVLIQIDVLGLPFANIYTNLSRQGFCTGKQTVFCHFHPVDQKQSSQKMTITYRYRKIKLSTFALPPIYLSLQSNSSQSSHVVTCYIFSQSAQNGHLSTLFVVLIVSLKIRQFYMIRRDKTALSTVIHLIFVHQIHAYARIKRFVFFCFYCFVKQPKYAGSYCSSSILMGCFYFSFYQICTAFSAVCMLCFVRSHGRSAAAEQLVKQRRK